MKHFRLQVQILIKANDIEEAIRTARAPLSDAQYKATQPSGYMSDSRPQPILVEFEVLDVKSLRP